MHELFQATPVARPATRRQVKLEGLGPETFVQPTCVTLRGSVQQERARNTKALSGVLHGFRKLTWKEIALRLFGAHLELHKVQYSKGFSSVDKAKADSSSLITAKLPLKDLEALGSIDDLPGGWRMVMLRGTMVVQLRSGDDEEAEGWMSAVAHNAAVNGISLDRQDAPYSRKRAWEYAEYTPKYHYHMHMHKCM